MTLTRLPLLALELTRRAARRRTYLLRVAWGAGLLWLFVSEVSGPGNTWTGAIRLGVGGRLIDQLVLWQLLGVALVIPSLMADAVAGERERGTLDLLRLCGLAPRRLLAQKLIGGLLTAWSHVLLGLPLMALAYALGGFSLPYLLVVVTLLALAPVQVGALTLWRSTVAPDVRRALWSSYLRLLVLLLTLPVVLFVVLIIAAPVLDGEGWLWCIVLWQAVSALACWRRAAEAFEWTPAGAYGPSGLAASRSRLGRSGPRPPAVAPSGPRMTDDIRDAPVAWRVYWRASGYLPVWLPVLGAGAWIAVIGACLGALTMSRATDPGTSDAIHAASPLDDLGHGIWLTALVLIALKTAPVVATEHRRRTLDPLLTTPTTGAELLRQTQVNGRLAAWLAGPPLILIAGAQAWIAVGRVGTWGALVYGGLSFALIVLTLRLALDLALVIGARLRRPGAAIVAGLLSLLLLAPTRVLLPHLLQSRESLESGQWALAWLIVLAVLHRGVRTAVVRGADRLLGRNG